MISEFRILKSAEVLWQWVSLQRLLNTVDVISLKETGLSTVNITRVETINPTLIGRVLIPEFFVDAHQFLQILTLINVNIYKACLKLLHFESNYQVFKSLRKMELDFVLLKILFEEVFHHFVVLVQQYFNIVLLVAILIENVVRFVSRFPSFLLICLCFHQHTVWVLHR